MNFKQVNIQKMGSNRIAAFCLLILIVVLFCGYVLISVNNRFQFDDLGFYVLVRNNGLWGAFVKNYFSWETTYLSLPLFFQLKFVDAVPPFVYNISILIVSILCFFNLIRTIVLRYALNLRTGDIFMFASLIILLTYFSCRAMGNVTYWVTAQIAYSLFLSFLFLGVHFWMKQKYLLASLCMFLFGHTRINYDAIFIAMYCCYNVFVWLGNNKSIINWKRHIPFVCFLAGVLTYVIIPGNYVRANEFASSNPGNHLGALFILNGWFSAFKHLAGTILNSWKQLIILPIGILVGIYLSSNDSLKKKLTIQFLFKCTIVFIVAYLGQATVLLIAIKTPVGYGRIFFFLELLLFILLILYGIYIGAKVKLVGGESIKLAFLSLIALPLLLFISSDYWDNWKKTSTFAKAYDRRIQLLKDIKQNASTKDVFLPPLPNSGVLEFMEISNKSEDVKNSMPANNAVYVRYYQLPFNIYLKN